MFYDAVVDGSARLNRHPDLDAAVGGAAKRITGDAWVWARKGAVDVSPLVAITLARWGATRPAPELTFAY
jgi:hypothetical protein